MWVAAVSNIPMVRRIKNLSTFAFPIGQVFFITPCTVLIALMLPIKDRRLSPPVTSDEDTGQVRSLCHQYPLVHQSPAVAEYRIRRHLLIARQWRTKDPDNTRQIGEVGKWPKRQAAVHPVAVIIDAGLVRNRAVQLPIAVAIAVMRIAAVRLLRIVVAIEAT